MLAKTATARGETEHGRRSDEQAPSFATARLRADWNYQAQPAPSTAADRNVELRQRLLTLAEDGGVGFADGLPDNAARRPRS